MRQLLTWTVTGLAAGWFVLTVMRSRREFGVLGDLVMGCLGAIVGGWLFRRPTRSPSTSAAAALEPPA